MQNIQLYIEGQRVEMFKDESVTITDSIKNVNDVSKVFTEFSKTFSLPASKKTNKIFKHFYNSDIENGYDARIRVQAKIELNNLPFKDGYIKLEGVDLKDNKAHTYKITFFGNTVSLKNIIGDDVLTDLTWLSNFNTYDNGSPIIYNAATVYDFARNAKDRTIDGIQYDSPLQAPLLTHTQRLYFDSGENTANSGNIYYNSSSSVKRGVRWDNLKLAVKLPMIIKAIEQQYNITFSNDFFNIGGGLNDQFENLYMWLHRTKGEVTNGGQVETQVKQVNTFPNSSDRAYTMVNNALTLNIPDDWEDATYSYSWRYFEPLRIYIRPATGYENVPYDAVVYYNGNVHWSSNNITGDVNGAQMPAFTGGAYTVVITSQDAIIFDEVIFQNWVVYRRTGVGFPSNVTAIETATSQQFEITTQFEFDILQQLPKMKVLDFLTSLFKMFNLVTYLEDGVIVVKKLEDFYSSGNTYDITKYIDVNKSQVNSALPFREVEYSYKGLKTFFAATHEQLFGKPWGTEEFTNNDTTKYSGGIFKQEIPLEHLKFERLLDIDTGDKTTIQWGWSVDDNRESFIGLPMIFYIEHAVSPQQDYISFVNSIAANGTFNSKIGLSTYFIPQNTDRYFNDIGNGFNIFNSINFKQELDEYTGEVQQKSLFNNCHVSYMTSVFNPSNRITKLTAYLPLGVLLNYKLNDKFLISEKKYKINSIKTNLQNGKSELELLNDYTQLLTLQENLFVYNGQPRISIIWNRFYGGSGFKLNINGIIYNITLSGATFTTKILSTYAPATELVISLEALDSSGNVLQTSNTLTVQI